MKRFVFSQEPILSLKRQLQRKSQLAVAQSAQAIEGIHAVIRAYRVDLAQAASQMESRKGSVTTPFFRSFQHIQACVLFEKQRLRVAEGEHVKLQQHLQLITAEVEALEFLRQQRITEHRKSIEKHEQELIEESSRVKKMIDQLESAKESSNV